MLKRLVVLIELQNVLGFVCTYSDLADSNGNT